MLTTQSIKKALALCGKTMEDIREWKGIELAKEYEEISIEKFCYYLHDINFSIAYIKSRGIEYTKESFEGYLLMLSSAIGLYQIGNEQPLQDLLNKIP